MDARLLVSLFMLIITAIATVGLAAAATHEIIWEKGFNRAAWESNHKCFMRDTLRFSYNPEQNNVMSVSHANFKSCDPSSPYSTFRTGKNLITIGRKDLFHLRRSRELQSWIEAPCAAITGTRSFTFAWSSFYYSTQNFAGSANCYY